MAKGITLTPCGLIIERIEPGSDALVIIARPTSHTAACPTCGQHSSSIHSRYQRSLSDLPSQGKLVRIKVQARRFRCLLTDCRQRIFVERLDVTVTRPFARRTARLEGLVHHLGLALGGRPGQSFARRLLLPVSKDILLRVVRRQVAQPAEAPRVVGIDDWAWKRGPRYGTIVCDLERRRIIDILPDREPATVTAWLAEHPSIAVIARDRGAGYRQAAAEGLPDAVQVADRWHLMENASAAFLNAVRRSMHAIRKAVGVGTVDPASLSAAERRQHSGWLLREAENASILALAAQGVAIKEIMRRMDKSRGLIRQVLRGARTDMFRSRMSSLDPFLTRLETACHRYQWLSGVPLRGDENAMTVNWLMIEISDASGKVTYRNSFITDLDVGRENVAELAAGGRARWKIENESFNVLKTKGYNLEHNFGHGKQHLATVLAILNLLAFACHTVCELGDRAWRAARRELVTRQGFFQSMRTITTYLLFQSWDDLLGTLAFIRPPPLGP